MRKTSMTHHLLSQIETGWVEFDCGRMTASPHSSASSLVEDDHVVDELRTELRETKERLAILEQQVQQLFKCREAVYIPKIIDRMGHLHNFNGRMAKFIPNGNQINPNQPDQYSSLYDAMVGDSDVPIRHQAQYLRETLHVLKSQLRHDLNNIVIQPRQTITPDCGVIIKFINDWMATSPNNIEITIMNTGATLAIGFVIALCEQLNCEKLSKLKITRAKISEQTELKNKIDKNIIKRMEIENLVSSV